MNHQNKNTIRISPPTVELLMRARDGLRREMGDSAVSNIVEKPGGRHMLAETSNSDNLTEAREA